MYTWKRWCWGKKEVSDDRVTAGMLEVWEWEFKCQKLLDHPPPTPSTKNKAASKGDTKPMDTRNSEEKSAEMTQTWT